MDVDIKKLCIICIFVAIILFILMLIYVWNFTIDDAFISFRYSEHLASGYGLVWNINHPPVEGYSNFLWILFITFSFLLKSDPLISSKVIGLISVFGCIILFWLLINDMFHDKNNKYVAFTVSTVFFLINPYTVTHAVSGMETMLYTFLLLLMLYCSWKIIISYSSKLTWLFAFTALLLSLIRPEGALISFMILFAIILVSYMENKEVQLKLFMPILILYLIPIAAYHLFRVYYFQELFPLPFLVKIVNGYTYPAEFISALIYLIPFIFIIIISFYVCKKNKTSEKHQKNHYNYLLLILGLILIFANISYIYTPLMNFSQRFYYPSFVLIYAVLGIATSLIFSNLRKNDKKIGRINLIKFIITIFLIFILAEANVNGIYELKNQQEYAISFEHSYISIGKALNQFSDDNYTVAFADAGAVAYLSRWNFLDLGGLNDKFIAHNGVTIEYLNKKNPELVILVSINGSIKSSESYHYVLENNYTRLAPIKHSGYYFIPFLKPNIKDYEAIKESLEKVSRKSIS